MKGKETLNTENNSIALERLKDLFNELVITNRTTKQEECMKNVVVTNSTTAPTTIHNEVFAISAAQI